MNAIKTLLIFVSLSITLGCETIAQANIFEWEYILGQGRRESSRLVPDGAGLEAIPNSNLSSKDLRQAYLIGVNLSNTDFRLTNLIIADLSNSDLSQANFTYANLTSITLVGADLTGAEIRGTNFAFTTSRGFTASQFYSTASYQAYDLSGIQLRSNNLNSWSFVRQDLSNAVFGYATLSEANLSQANLTNATFASATLDNADLTQAEVLKADFSRTTSRGFTATQLYSTASYQAKDLTEIKLKNNNMSSWDFSEQNLTHASLESVTMTNADLSQANLTFARFNSALLTNVKFDGAILTNADLTLADLRGATGVVLDEAIVKNSIGPNGTLDGLNLIRGRRLLIRDHDGNPEATPTPTNPIPIFAQQKFIVDASGKLQLLIEDDAWDSTISFESGIDVSIEGILSLDFVSEVDLFKQVGRTLDLFDWTGVSPSGTFTVESPYTWDISQLYTTGEVTLLAVPEPSSSLLLLSVVALLVSKSRMSSM